MIQQAAGDDERARQALERAVYLNSNHEDALLSLALLARRRGDEVGARRYQQRATRGSAFAKALGKQSFYRQIELDLPAAYAYATEVMAAASQTEDAQENLRAFLEKRAPHFVNR